MVLGAGAFGGGLFVSVPPCAESSHRGGIDGHNPDTSLVEAGAPTFSLLNYWSLKPGRSCCVPSEMGLLSIHVQERTVVSKLKICLKMSASTKICFAAAQNAVLQKYKLLLHCFIARCPDVQFAQESLDKSLIFPLYLPV